MDERSKLITFVCIVTITIFLTHLTEPKLFKNELISGIFILMLYFLLGLAIHTLWGPI